MSSSPEDPNMRPVSGDWSGVTLDAGIGRSNTDDPRMHGIQLDRERQTRSMTPHLFPSEHRSETLTERSQSPPPLPTREAIERALALSERLSKSNIPTQVTDTGDLMLDMTGYKSSDDDALRAEVIARKILSEELEGNYDIGALIGADEHGNLWIYSSEEAKEAASERAALAGIGHSNVLTSDAASDPGYHSESDTETGTPSGHRRTESDGLGMETPPKTPTETAGDPNRNYAKTLRLTSDQLKALGLKSGPNSMSFTVNRATCTANMYLWKYDSPVIVSDIDGTITKSDALGHLLYRVGRDWTHMGVAKLYTEIANNGYNIMYLTSRSVGQADNTRDYLDGIVQDGYRLPKGPTILSPDRTIAALRRELYIRKPEVFKMACLRDIKNLFGPSRSPFYAGFGNRITDALSYRSVNIPSNRIFTINSYGEIAMDLLIFKSTYVNMREVVDHYFPPVNSLVKSGGEEYTDFRYWREPVLDFEDFSDSESDEKDGEEEENESEEEEGGDEDEEEEEEENDELGNSYISRDSFDGDEQGRLDESMISMDEQMPSIEEDETASETEGEDDEEISPKQAADLLQNPAAIRDMSARRPSAQSDMAGEAITGMKGLSLEREGSDDKKV